MQAMYYLSYSTISSMRWELTNSNSILFSEFFKKETRIPDLFERNFNIDEILSVCTDNITRTAEIKIVYQKLQKESCQLTLVEQ